MPVRIKAGEKEWTTHAMLDDGATRTIISQRAADKLEAERRQQSTYLHTVEGVTHKVRDLVAIEVQSLDEKVLVSVDDALVGDFLTTEEDKPAKDWEVKGLEYMEGVHFEDIGHEDIDLILSVDHCWTWLGGELRRTRSRSLVALKTAWGWTLAGGKKGNQSIESCLRTAVEEDNGELHRLLTTVFNKDFPEVKDSKKHPSLDDEHAVKQMRDTIRFDEAINHYRIGLPWVKSREEAAKRLNAINTLSTKPRFALLLMNEGKNLFHFT